jgi:D-alanyl-D-alanine carboxypeptidase
LARGLSWTLAHHRRLPVAAALIALACVAAPAAQAAPVTPVPGLPADALTAMNEPAYASAQWFVSVRDLATGASVVSLKSKELAEPGGSSSARAAGS